MANLLSHSPIEERLDLNFTAGSAVSFRERPAKYWRTLIEGAGGKVLSSGRSADIDAYVFSQSSLFVYDQRLVVVTCAPGGVLGVGLNVMWREAEARVETLVYQRHGGTDASAREFRKGLSRLRDEARDRLGPAVVTGETALFYPSQRSGQVISLNRPLLAGGRGCVQLFMRRLSPKIETALKRSDPVQRKAAVRLLGIDQLLKGFEMTEYHFQPAGFVITGLREDEYFTLHVSNLGARFEFGGRLRAELNQAILRLLSAFAPREHHIEALHGGRDLPCLDCVPGTRWEPQPLGQHDSRFVLCANAEGF